MPPELISALVQGGATAVLLGLVLARLAPKMLRAYERMSREFLSALHEERRAYREEAQRERDTHRDEARMLAAGIDGVRMATEVQTRELQLQTCELRELRRDLSQDLPGPPSKPYPEPGRIRDTVDLSDEESP